MLQHVKGARLALGAPKSLSVSRVWTLQRQEIRQQLLAFGRHDRFRMELHAFDFQFAMAQSHDYAITRCSRDFETRRQRLAFDNQRMIPAGVKILSDFRENRFPIVRNYGRLPMKELRRAHNPAAKSLADGLMPKTNTKQRNFAAEV